MADEVGSGNRVGNFDVLKRMAAENKNLQLCTTITKMNYKSSLGTEVSVGVPGNICFDVSAGRTQAVLLVWDIEEFNEMKRLMESEG